MRRSRIQLALVAAIVAVAGCSTLADGDVAVDEPVEQRAAITLTEAQILEVEAFWLEVADSIGLAYEPLDPNRIIARSALENGVGDTTCSYGGEAEELDPNDVIDNAFVTGCDEGITVVYDDVEYVPTLERKYRGAGPAMLFAHEWGHVIQFQLELFDQEGLLAEQQADCWSGAYAAWAEDNDVAPFTDPAALDLAIISTLETRDEIGVDPEVEDSHGNGFDRVRATQEGYERGVEFCKGYDDDPPPITQIGFLDAEDEDNAGNLPFDEADELLSTEVGEFYESLTAESLEEFVELPRIDDLQDLYDAIGDNAVGTEYSLRYAEALQEAEGLETQGADAALQRACLTGAWLHDVLSSEDPAAGQLSPFDLDEAIQTFATSDDLLSNPGLVFDTIASLRTGTLDGLSACDL